MKLEEIDNQKESEELIKDSNRKKSQTKDEKKRLKERKKQELKLIRKHDR